MNRYLRNLAISTLLTTFLSFPTIAIEITDPEDISRSTDPLPAHLQRFEPAGNGIYFPASPNGKKNVVEPTNLSLPALVSQMEDFSQRPAKNQESRNSATSPPLSNASPVARHPDIVLQLMGNVRESIKQSPEALQFLEAWRKMMSQLPESSGHSNSTGRINEQSKTTDLEVLTVNIPHENEDIMYFVSDWIDRLTHPVTLLVVVFLLAFRAVVHHIRDRSP